MGVLRALVFPVVQEPSERVASLVLCFRLVNVLIYNHKYSFACLFRWCFNRLFSVLIVVVCTISEFLPESVDVNQRNQ